MTMRRLTPCVVLLVVASLGADRPPAEPRTLDELRQALSATVAAMPAVSVEYSAKLIPDAPRAQAGPDPAWPGRHVWRFAGDRYFFRWGGGPDHVPITQVTDGAQHYEMYEFLGQTHVRISDAVRERYLQNPFKPTPLIGSALTASEMTLAEALRSPKAELIGIEEVGGAACHRVEIRGIPSLNGGADRWVTAWLDPARDMLPRRVRIAQSPDDPNLRERRENFRDVKFTWEATEFMPVKNPAAKRGESWFPARATFRQKSSHVDIEIREVTILKEAPADWFEVAIPADAKVRYGG